MPKAVRFDLQDRLEVLLREGRVIVSEIVGGIRVLPRAGLGDDLGVFFRRISRSPAKHHVLEEVGKAGLARFELVARSGLYWNLHRDDVRKPGSHRDHLQPVGQRLLHRLERKNLAGG